MLTRTERSGAEGRRAIQAHTPPRVRSTTAQTRPAIVAPRLQVDDDVCAAATSFARLNPSGVCDLS